MDAGGEFNSEDHYIYYCGQESLRRNRTALIIKKRVPNSVLGWNLKMTDDLGSFQSQTIQYHSNSNLCPTTNAKEAEVEWLHEGLKGLLELTS